MPIIKSAKKRVKVAEKAAIRNSKTKRTLKTALKSFHKAITGDKKAAGETHSAIQSNIDKAVKKGIIHKNKAARQKRQLAAAAKNAGASVAGSGKKAAAKPAAKPAAATKAAPAKKTTAKPTAKKPAATKKPTAKK